jgi:flagellar basal-body rod protein FlgB
MDPSRIALFGLAERRLSWIAQRQNVLASNIANADTPGYKARDIQPFSAILSGLAAVEPIRTQRGHLPGLADPKASITKDSAPARSLDGNDVSLDQQLTKVADTDSAQTLVTTIWKKYVGFFNIALGR